MLLLATLLTSRGSRRAWAGTGALLLGAAVLAGPWWAFVALSGISSPGFAPITWPAFLANLDRWPTILGLTAISLLAPGWSYLWPLALPAGLLLRRTRRAPAPRPENLLLVTALLYVAATGFFYAFSTYAPYQQHILSSVDRLIAEVAPLMLLWLVFRGYPRPLPDIAPELYNKPAAKNLQTGRSLPRQSGGTKTHERN